VIGPTNAKPTAQSDAAKSVIGPGDVKPSQDPAFVGIRLLRWIQTGAERLNYAGTVIHQEGKNLRSSRLIHVVENGVAQEKLQPLDGSPREYLRRADEVQFLLPESRRVVIEQSLSRESFPGISTGDPLKIVQHYSFSEVGFDRVAGFECQKVNIDPKDKLRYSYRLCVEKNSGLLLRATTVNEQNEPVEQIWFAEVKTGDRVIKAQLRPSWSTAGWQVERVEQTAVDLARLGWVVTPPTGFQKLRQVERARWAGGSERKAMQAVFSDGLASVSVFIEPVTQETAVIEAEQSSGLASAYVRRVGDSRITVVGDVPLATVRAMAKSIDYRAP
jgi:sigma-E factor negative regulatory protein RseB